MKNVEPPRFVLGELAMIHGILRKLSNGESFTNKEKDDANILADKIESLVHFYTSRDSTTS